MRLCDITTGPATGEILCNISVKSQLKDYHEVVKNVELNVVSVAR